jgi:hypothetical protein
MLADNYLSLADNVATALHGIQGLQNIAIAQAVINTAQDHSNVR